jgi:butyrate kinase
MAYRILVINPGSTSTKLAIFQDSELQLEQKIQHPAAELKAFPEVWQQLNYRLSAIQTFLTENQISVSRLDAIVGRGGIFKSVPGGTYRVNAAMLEDARIGVQGEHPANLGCVLAQQLAAPVPIPAFIVDPISVDEFEPLARYSGHPLIERRCLSHALNIHAVGREAAKACGIPFESANLIIAHLGGGISVCPLKGGRIIDVNDASSDGPFSPERTGGLPLQQFLKLCFSGERTYHEMRRLVMGEGGLLAYLNTNDAAEIEKRIAGGDPFAEEVYTAMGYQIAKEIGAMTTVLKGDIHAIVISGGLAHSNRLISEIKSRINFMAEVLIFAGEFEMAALAQGALRVLKNEETALDYI